MERGPFRVVPVGPAHQLLTHDPSGIRIETGRIDGGGGGVCPELVGRRVGMLDSAPKGLVHLGFGHRDDHLHRQPACRADPTRSDTAASPGHPHSAHGGEPGRNHRPMCRQGIHRFPSARVRPRAPAAQHSSTTPRATNTRPLRRPVGQSLRRNTGRLPACRRRAATSIAVPAEHSPHRRVQSG